MELEFVTCAVNRPNILDKTYSSLQKHLKGVNFQKSKLYIHIDKTPSQDNISEVENIAKKYFPNTLAKYTDIDKLPRYSRSFKWAMEQPKNNYFFYIEDDWNFVKDFHINEFLNIFKNNKDVHFIAINNNWTHYGVNCPDFVLNDKKKKLNYKPKEIICTTPSVYDNNFIKKFIIKNLEEIGENAETQMRKIGKNLKTNPKWLSEKNHYYCEDLGVNWSNNNNIPQKDIHLFCYYNLCENCKKTVPEKKFFCKFCRRRWCSQNCKNQQIEEHNKQCEYIIKTN